MFKGLSLALLIAVSTPALAGKVAQLFSDGVFGVQWGANLDEVKASFPEGEVKTYIGIDNYIVPHSKPVLGITRQDTDITFTFNADKKLHAVGVSFEGNEFTDVYSALNTHFGKHQPVSGSQTIRWPTDEGISMYLVSFPTGFSIKPMLTIEYIAPMDNASKDELGFN